LFYVDNEELDAEVSATTEPGTDEHIAASKKIESVGPPARPQPPVCIISDVLFIGRLICVKVRFNISLLTTCSYCSLYVCTL